MGLEEKGGRGIGYHVNTMPFLLLEIPPDTPPHTGRMLVVWT